MKKLHFILLLLIFSSAVFGACTKKTEFESKPDKPLNILLITADDLGKQLTCYGDDIIETPNIDKLATRGMMFHNAYVSMASCSSSRSSILTGTYPHTNGQIGLAHLGFSMKKEYPNLAQTLKNNGYETGIIGKLHVKPEKIFPFDFDRKNYKEARDVELVASRVDSFITNAGEKPFFMYLNYSDPHVPFYREYNGHPLKQVNPSDVRAFAFQGVDDEPQLQRIADYYCCVRRLDEGIGLLMKKLEKNKVLENTVIIFIGDHGAPFTRGKTASYEASVNIPYFVIYPGMVAGNQQSEALVSTVDIYPTILDILDIPVPGEVQGKSLLPVVTNQKEGVRDYLFTEFNYHVKKLNSFYPRRTVRNDRYKLVLNLAASLKTNSMKKIDGDQAYDFSQTEKYDGTWVREVFDRLLNPPEIELFDIENDPYEKNNLSHDSSYDNIKNELLEQVLQWMEETNDPFLKIEDISAEISSLNNE